VTGQTQVSAVVDDDAPLARVQLLIDGNAVGAPLTTPPYSMTFDTTSLSSSVPHTVGIRASDMLGRTSTSGLITVQVDNGPRISAVAFAPGLTATSMRITWTTDILADAQVEFGPTQSYGSTTPVDTQADWRHSMELTGLLPGVQYHFRVRSRDANGAVGVSADQTFFTAPQ
jgi:hypothetical protein